MGDMCRRMEEWFWRLVLPGPWCPEEVKEHDLA